MLVCGCANGGDSDEKAANKQKTSTLSAMITYLIAFAPRPEDGTALLRRRRVDGDAAGRKGRRAYNRSLAGRS